MVSRNGRKGPQREMIHSDNRDGGSPRITSACISCLFADFVVIQSPSATFAFLRGLGVKTAYFTISAKASNRSSGCRR